LRGKKETGKHEHLLEMIKTKTNQTWAASIQPFAKSWSPRAVSAADASFARGDEIIIATVSAHFDNDSAGILVPTGIVAKLGVRGVACPNEGTGIVGPGMGKRPFAFARRFLGTSS
jgi:hypothetical protein